MEKSMNDAIYTFQGKDITMNVCIQIRAVVDLLQKKSKISFEDAMMLIYHLNTYKTLQESGNALWAESTEYILDRYFAEQETPLFF